MLRAAEIGHAAVDAAFDAAADQEQRRGFTVVGSAAAIFCRCAGRTR